MAFVYTSSIGVNFHALSHDGVASSNSLKQLIPAVSVKSTSGKRIIPIATASSSQQISNHSVEYWGKAPHGCWDAEVGVLDHDPAQGTFNDAVPYTRAEDESGCWDAEVGMLDDPQGTFTDAVTAIRAEDESKRPVKRLCVFSGSSSAEIGVYTQVAQELGTELVQRGITLVYGGGSSRLMGKVAETVKDAGGSVVGVIPQALMKRGVFGDKIADFVAVDDMHRKKWLPEMIRLADAFLALPGGMGALDEVDEMITMANLGLHKKPVGLLNVNGFFDPVISSWLKKKSKQSRSLQQPNDDIVVYAATVSELLDKLQMINSLPGSIDTQIYQPTLEFVWSGHH